MPNTPMHRVISWTTLAGATVLLTQCTSLPELGTNSLAFTSSQSSAPEGTNVTVQVELDRAVRTDLEVEFEAFFTGSYFYDAELTTPSPLIIEAGQRVGNITFTTQDDGVMELNGDTLTLNITGVSDPDIILPETGLRFQHTITDNDIPELPSTGVRVYLTWDAATQSFNDADLDLILSYDNGTSIDPLLVSESTLGFEDVGLAGTAADGDYYLSVRFLQTRNDLQNDVEFTMVFAQEDGSLTYAESFLRANQVGETILFIKMNKEGTDFTYSAPE